MLTLLWWLAGWTAAPALLLVPSALDPGLRPTAVHRVVVAVLVLVAIAGQEGALAAGALAGAAAGWTLGGTTPARAVVGLGLVAALLGWAATDGPMLSGVPLERAVTWALVAPAGCWALAAAVGIRLARQGALGSAAAVLVVLGCVAEASGRPHMASAGAAVCVVGGGLLAAGLSAYPRGGRAALLALLPLAVAVLRPPIAAGPYDHPAGLKVREAVELEMLVGDGALISSLAALPDGRIAYGEFASGWIHLLNPITGTTSRLGRVPVPEIRGARDNYELGLWGLAVPPSGAWVYAMAVHRWDEDDPDPSARSSRIVRVSVADGHLEEVLAGIPAGPVHAGGALAFDATGTLLFASVGDGLRYGARGDEPAAPSDAGSVLRLTADGGVPADNPEVGSPVWARGFRNVYGLALDGDGTLWATANGPDCCDGLLRVEPGRDHGWPPGQAGSPVLPVWESGPQRLGPTGLAVLSSRYGALEGDLVFATWHTGALHRVRVDGRRVIEHEILLRVPTSRPTEGAYAFAGAFTGLTTAPNGTLWFSTLNGVGRVLAMAPP